MSKRITSLEDRFAASTKRAAKHTETIKLYKTSGFSNAERGYAMLDVVEECEAASRIHLEALRTLYRKLQAGGADRLALGEVIDGLEVTAQKLEDAAYVERSK